MTVCACRMEFRMSPAMTYEHGPLQCVGRYHAELDVPDILTGTTKFMRLGGQLDTAGRADMWPVNVPEGLRQLRRDLLEEEYHEYDRGEDDDDLVEVVDGLLDVIVVAWGSLLAYVGEEKALAAAREVTRSNLSKVDGSIGPIQLREDGKIIKPEGWMPPDIARAISDE